MKQDRFLRCVICGEEFKAARADAKTCSDACRAKKSRRVRDPHIGSQERKLKQRAGLDAKYAYRQRGQAREALQELGIVPTGWLEEANEPARFHPRTFDPLLWHRRKSERTIGRWSPSDGWWIHETMLGLAHPSRIEGVIRVHIDSPLGRKLWPQPGESWQEVNERIYSDVECRWGFRLAVLNENPGRIEWVQHPNGTVWPTRISATEHTKGKTRMLATDERTALDVEELVEAVNHVLAVVLRLQARFPSSRVLRQTVDDLLMQIQGA